MDRIRPLEVAYWDHADASFSPQAHIMDGEAVWSYHKCVPAIGERVHVRMNTHTYHATRDPKRLDRAAEDLDDAALALGAAVLLSRAKVV
jgi:hypothetical protein